MAVKKWLGPPAPRRGTAVDRNPDAVDHRRRRRLLYRLRGTDSIAIEEAARRIAAHERDTDVATVPDDGYERVLTSLYHKRLSRLDDLGIVAYDRRSGDARLDDPPENSKLILELVRSLDEGTDR